MISAEGIQEADFLCLVPAGGLGSRLNPLTSDRAKPSIAISYDDDGSITRMIDIPLSAIREAGGVALVSTLYAPESLDFVNEYEYAQTTHEAKPQTPIDTLIDYLPLLEQSSAAAIAIVPGDAWVSAPLLQDMQKALENHQTDAVILGTNNLDGHNVRSVDAKGIITSPDKQERMVADLGVHFFDKTWLLERLKGLAMRRQAGSVDIWDDLYTIDNPSGEILIHIAQDSPEWIDMGTPMAFYRSVLGLNRSHTDKNNNVVFPGARVHPTSSGMIALPRSSGVHIPMQRAIIPEGKTMTVSKDALVA